MLVSVMSMEAEASCWGNRSTNDIFDVGIGETMFETLYTIAGSMFQRCLWQQHVRCDGERMLGRRHSTYIYIGGNLRDIGPLDEYVHMGHIPRIAMHTAQVNGQSTVRVLCTEHSSEASQVHTVTAIGEERAQEV